MKIKSIFLYMVLTATVGGGFLIAVHQRHIRTEAMESLEQHARVIASALWKYETEDPAAYLRLAAELNHYRQITVTNDYQNEFISIKGPLPGKVEAFLIRLGLIPVILLKTPVIYKNTNIGEIQAQWYNKAIYSYLYASFCLVLIFALLWFFLNLAAAKKTLETRVSERTAQLNDLRKYLSSIINSMPSVLIGVDEDNRVTHWNNTAEKATGIPSKEAQGKYLARVFPRMSGDLEKITRSILRHEVSLERNKPRQSEDGICYDDITIFPLMGACHKGAVIRIDDATARVRMEEMMIQSEKMLSVGGLAAGMAHEINNPLAGMMQTADVMKNRLDATVGIEANEKAAQKAGTTMEAIHRFMEARGIFRMISTINDSGKRVAAIVENMLSFARKSDAGAVPWNLSELMDKTLELAITDYDLKKQYDFKLIKIKKEYTPQIPEVICEGPKIQQVLLNILRNGAQAMQSAGTEQPCFFIRVFGETDGENVCMEISDNGPGMDENTRKRIFEPFFTTKPVGEGTGLGLSVSYFIISETHGGTLSVESRPGEGASFIIRLPVHPASWKRDG